MFHFYDVKRPGRSLRRRRCLILSMFLALSLMAIPEDGWGQELTETQWTLLKEVENVRFFYAQSECESQAFVLLKVENTNPSKVFGRWYVNITADGTTTQYAGTSLPLEPMSMQSGSCQQPDPFLAILQTKVSSDILVSIDVEITKP